MLIEMERRNNGRAVAALEVWRNINWWTPLTIVEACDELAAEHNGVLCHKGPVGKRYRAVDYDAGVRYNKRLDPALRER